MKPLHVGLLVVGAALAGGLAVKMSQPPAYRPTAPVSAVPAKPAAPPASVPDEPAGASVASASSVTPAPPPVYEQPAAPKPAPAKPEKVRTAPAKPTPTAVHPPHVAVVARVSPPVTPPTPYQAPPPAVEPAPPASPAPSRIDDFPSVPAPVETVPSPPPPPAPLRVTLNQGTQLAVRLDQGLAADHLFPGDSFQGSLAEPLVVDGFIVGERGARVTGRVVASRAAGRLSGSSELQLALASFQTADGQRIAISTEPWSQQGNSGRGDEVAKIGGGAALGAIIGAIAGGGKGAAIGAGVGGAAGTGAAAATRGKSVTIPSETVIRFRLASRVTITERQLQDSEARIIK